MAAKAGKRFRWSRELGFSLWTGIVAGTSLWGLELLVFVAAKFRRPEMWFYIPLKALVFYILTGILLSLLVWVLVFVVFKLKKISQEGFRRVWALVFIGAFLVLSVLTFFFLKAGPALTEGPRGLLNLGLMAVFSVLLAVFITRSAKRVKNLVRTMAVFAGVCILACLVLAFFYDLNTETLPEADLVYQNIAGKKPNVILIVADALRADHLGCYGARGISTPNIDRIAREGVLFENCFSTAPWTRPSMGSIMTSLYPSQHGALRNVVKKDATFQTIEVLEDSPLHPDNTTMTEVLKEHGYYTIAFQPNLLAGTINGFWQGYDFHFDCFKFRWLMFEELASVVSNGVATRLMYPSFKYARDDALQDYITTWISGNARAQFFLLALYFDVHEYHLKEKRDKEEFYNPSERFYNQAVEKLDERIGKLYSFLEETGLLDGSILVLLADHGEEFGEHGGRDRGNEKPYDRGAFHGHTLYDELLRIPLIIRYPEKIDAGTVIPQQVRSLDIMPTVFALADVPCDLKIEGVSLYQDGVRVEDDLPVFAESVLEGTEKKAMRVAGWKLIYHPAYEKYELYNIARRPGEQKDLGSENPDVLERLKRRMSAWMQRMESEKRPVKTKRILTAKEIEALKALGYIK